ncbi:fibronectin type III domain-containing protein [Agromyces fucosus]|uniref:Fibronectin type III domain-containing protein n=1 Tax=Agromyces fucosus TaxID=41985 RepID=A0A4Q2JFX6_9MICO|nr:Ig-like domain-containing protein [Agromyces fucosus]RXZ46502.1 fibronectin type III domain-containing protein [Agromyces fucosus]
MPRLPDLSRLPKPRSAAITAAATTAVVALVAGVAIASGGYAAQRVDLGDAAVWVSSNEHQAIGRANTALLELNSVVETGSTGIDILQQGPTVLALDRARATVRVIDATTSSISETVAVPPDDAMLSLAGSRVVIVSDGDVWTTPLDAFAQFDADAEPMLSFGKGSVTSVDPDGTLVAYTPSTGDVALVDAADAETARTRWQIESVAGDPDVQITSVADRWAVLDAGTRTLHLDRGAVDLSEFIAANDEPVLQQASSHGDEVAIATRRGLITVGLDGGAPITRVDGRSGLPAVPIVHNGCLYAAWAAGTAVRACGAGPAEPFELPSATRSGDYTYLANGATLVLNERRSGKTWAVGAEFGLIDNWQELLDIERDEETIEQNDPDTPPTIEKSQVAPVAADDEFGARPGRTTPLPVLLNDYDANGDALVIEAVDGELPPGVALDRIAENQQLQLVLGDEASGVIAFGYTVDDGFGGAAHATVSVTVRETDENAPPEQRRSTKALVQQGGRVSTAVLGDWVDPDGDPFFLKRATSAEPDSLSSTADGVVVFDEKGGAGAERSVSLEVSDGRDTAVGVLGLGVRAPGDVPLVADPFVVLATAGQEVRVDPLQHVRGGSGTIQLSAVPAKPDAQLTPDFDGGTFRFVSSAVRTHSLEYTVTDGTWTTTGVVRVDVSAPPELGTTPITVPHTAFVRNSEPVDVDVLATDIDPTGGVLILTGLGEPEAEAAVQVEVIEHRILRVTLSGPLETGSTVFGYRISNGLAEAEGEVTVVEVPQLEVAQPPVAVPDKISARTGDVVDIAVLANDEHPDALPITLEPVLEREPEAGLLFVDGDRLRYFAPETPGEYEAVYRITGPGPQSATATVQMSVRAADPETNTPPVPATVTARVLAGDTVRIPVPLSGSDPEGDSVQLLGQGGNPELGNVTSHGADWFEYQAGEYSAGTDEFEYEVVDALGAPAVGTVRVGIAPRLDGARKPIAGNDVVEVRPGRTVAVRVLENDSDPDGGALTLESVEATEGDAVADIVDDTIEVVVPPGEGEYGFVYVIQNEQLSEASTFLSIIARDDAPLARPEASDTVLTLSDILDKEFVNVPVLRNVFLADADVSDLVVGLVDGYDAGAEVRRDGSIRVQVEDRRRVIPFSVAHPEDPSIIAYAFIWVPGRDDALPQLRADAPRVEVMSGEEFELELDDFVIAASGRPVRITDAATVRASHSDGSDLVVDQDTLRYRSEEGYYGPASLSFTVTDGESATDPSARTGTIVIPIEVAPTEDQPPVFTGGVIDFEPGQSKDINLVKLTNYPYPSERDELAYRLLPPPTEGFRFSLDGSHLTIEADASTTNGTVATVAIGVADEAGDGRSGRIELHVVPSTRPIARPAADTAVAQRGRTTTIDVLANDGATNPFPDVPLRVVDVRGADADSLPDGISIVPSDDRSKLEVTVAQGAAPVNSTVQYEVADATGDAARNAWGLVTISVQDRPDPVTGAQVTGFGDRTLDLVFGAGAFNNSPITGYEIELVDAATGDAVSSSECAATTCTVSTPGNGQSDAVQVRIRARNGIGLSDPVAAPGPVWSDVIPPPPSGVRAVPRDGYLRVEWDPVPAGSGSAIGSYVVTVAGVSNEVSAAAACTATLCSTDSQPLENGSQVPITVGARNQAFPALAVWTEAGTSGTPFGPPVAGAIFVNGDAAAGTVTVAWDAFGGNGDPIGGYFVQRLVDGASGVPGGAQACSVTSPAPGSVVAPSSGGTVAEVVHVGPGTTSVQFAGTGAEATRYSFLVWGYNRAACANTEVVGTIVRPSPDAIRKVDSRMGMRTADVYDRYIAGVSPGAWRYDIVAVDGNGAQIPGTLQSFGGSGWAQELFARPFGETVRFQVRSCSIWGSCGPWSDVLPSDARPSLTFALPSRAWNESAKTWSWTSAPENSGLPVTFSCGVDGDRNGRQAQTPTSCDIPEAKPGDLVWLDVEIADIVVRYQNR